MNTHMQKYKLSKQTAKHQGQDTKKGEICKNRKMLSEQSQLNALQYWLLLPTQHWICTIMELLLQSHLRVLEIFWITFNKKEPNVISHSTLAT